MGRWQAAAPAGAWRLFHDGVVAAPGRAAATMATLAAVLAAVLSGCVADGPRPAETVPVPPGGCIGAPVRDCLSHLAGLLSSEDYADAMERLAVAPAAAEAVKGDRGRSTALLSVPLGRSGQPLRGQPLRGLYLRYGPDQRIRGMSVALRGNPFDVDTEPRFDWSGIYPALRLALGSSCPEVKDTRAVHDLIEQTIAPRIITKPIADPDPFRRTKTVYFSTRPVTICGSSLFIDDLRGRAGHVPWYDRGITFAVSSLEISRIDRK